MLKDLKDKEKAKILKKLLKEVISELIDEGKFDRFFLNERKVETAPEQSQRRQFDEDELFKTLLERKDDWKKLI